MKEREVEKQLKALQQEIALAGEEVEALRRNQRAGLDALRLEVEALRRCLVRVHPDLEGCFAAVRAEVMQQTDPEAL
jgi:predicted  nucleic acid-binding Zn-ribbon protein